MQVTFFFIIIVCYHRTFAFLSTSDALAHQRQLLKPAVASHHRDSLGDCTPLLEESYSSNFLAVSTRKALLKKVLKDFSTLSITSSLTFLSSPVNASGGATAGGAYLLSAKQRYNKRVLAGVKTFLALDARDLKQVESFFASEEEGGWEDMNAAGYLLANAFRTSSTKAPDALPSVKKWKIFVKDVELLKRSLASKDGEKVLMAYKSAEKKLDDYLEEVDLSSISH